MRTVNLPPYAPTLIESTRSIGYTLEAAIADIIDNSMSAQASFIDIFFFPADDSYIAILDDGTGMDSNSINTAMRYGSQNPNEKRVANDLGRFGLGMKTASLSQCRTLTVISKQDNTIEARQWDIDHVITKDDWSLIILDTDEELNDFPHINDLRNLKNGTLVIWQNLDRLRVGESDFDLSMGNKMDTVRSHLSLVFHGYINGEPGLPKVQINMNNVPIIAADPFLTRRNNQVMSDECIYIDGATVIVRPYILPHISSMTHSEIEALGGNEGLRKSQGFYVYRNKRLLVWGTWFRMMRQSDLSKLARVQVDIPNELDYLWTLDIKKSIAIPPEVVRKNLIAVIEQLALKSKRTWEYRGKKETHDSIVHVWQRYKGKHGGYFYDINRNHPLVLIFKNESVQVQRNIEALLKVIELNLPLNQLYIDMQSDKPIECEKETTLQDIESILIGLLEQMSSDRAKSELLEQLCNSDPFVNYPEVIERYKRSGV